MPCEGGRRQRRVKLGESLALRARCKGAGRGDVPVDSSRPTHRAGAPFEELELPQLPPAGAAGRAPELLVPPLRPERRVDALIQDRLFRLRKTKGENSV